MSRFVVTRQTANGRTEELVVVDVLSVPTACAGADDALQGIRLLAANRKGEFLVVDPTECRFGGFLDQVVSIRGMEAVSVNRSPLLVPDGSSLGKI